MGEVYRARDTRLQRDVAIKILPASLANDADRLRRFEQEARAVAALNHPNLLTVFDVGTAPLIAASPSGGGNGIPSPFASDPNGSGSSSGSSFANPPSASGSTSAQGESPYIVSELLEGASLREKLSSGAMRERKAIDYAIQIARGLAAAHERGIVHRDIKPDNIFITNDGRVKILDFGLAKLTEKAADSADPDQTMGPTGARGTQIGVVMGTLGYMSPEQVRGKPADARSDIFSFGAVVYEMLSGKRAFRGDTSADLMSAILNHEPPELTATNTEISPTVDRIVHHCMEKDAQQRFQSAGDIAFQLNELSGLRSSSGAQALADGHAAANIATADAVKTWSVAKLAAFGALALAVLLPATWFLARRSAKFTPPSFAALTYQTGVIDSARFLADGRTWLCVARWGSDQNFSLYTGSTEAAGLRSLDVAADSIESVSAAGEILLVQNQKSVGPGYARAGTLARVSLNGGSPRPLLDNIQFADWAPGGNDYAVVRFVPERHSYRLEYPVGKVLYETRGWIGNPRFSRDGKQIAFLDHPIFGDDAGAAAVIDLAGNKKILSRPLGTTQFLTWSPDGTEIWFSGAASSVDRGVFAVDLSGRERVLLTSPGYSVIRDALPNGQVLVSEENNHRQLYVSTPEFPKPRDFTWLDWAYGARFSRDGKQILFGDQHSGDKYSTLLRNLDGSPAVRLGDGDPMDLSDDGRWALSRTVGPPEDLLLLPTGAGEPRQLTQGGLTIVSARWLADNRIVLNASEANHRVRAYIVDLSGTVKPVSPEGLRALAATPDGKQLLTWSDDTSTFELLPVNGGTPTPFAQLKKGDNPVDFTSDGTAVLVRRPGAEGSVEIWSVAVKGDKRTLLRTISPPDTSITQGGFSVTVSRDGKSYAYQTHPATSRVFLVSGLR
jgi:eukaryotic-like serine/threonine-protein kinase